MTAKKSHTLSLMAGAALALALTAGCGRKAPAAGSWEIDGPTPTPPVYWAQVQNRTVYALDRDITLEVPGDAQALLHELEAMRALETVTFTGGAVDNETQDRLRAARPDLTFRCDTQLLGRAWPWDTTTLSLAVETFAKNDADAREIVLATNVFEPMKPSAQHKTRTKPRSEEEALLAEIDGAPTPQGREVVLARAFPLALPEWRATSSSWCLESSSCRLHATICPGSDTKG